MAVIDFHTHILPGIDDGSRSVEESMEMLIESARQGVDVMLATSHFYPGRDRVERFLERRRGAYNKLQAAMKKSRRKLPQIKLGAEVAFFEGISRAGALRDLTIEGTDLLLLEMPFGKWTTADLEEIEEIVDQGDVRIVLAHLERFLQVPANKKRIYELMELPLFVQVNAGSLLDWKTRSKTIKLLDRKGIGLLGSDCHGIRHRVPNLKEGREMIRKKLGEDFYVRMDNLCQELVL